MKVKNKIFHTPTCKDDFSENMYGYWTCPVCGNENPIQSVECPVCEFQADSTILKNATKKAFKNLLENKRKLTKKQRIKACKEILLKIIHIMNSISSKIDLITPKILKILKITAASLLMLSGICVVFIIIIGAFGIRNVGIVPMIQSIMNANKYTSIIASVIAVFDFGSPANSMRNILNCFISNIVFMYNTVSNNIINFTKTCFGG